MRLPALRLRRLFVLAFVVLAWAATAHAQPTATFRSSTRLVVHAVTVTDARGNVVEGLTANDFVVTENGERQEIAFVEFQRLDDTRATEPAPEPAEVRPPARTSDAAPQALSAGPFPNRRLLVFYFDLSAMPIFDQLRAVADARKYVDSQLTVSDLVAIMAFQNGAVRIRQDFTNSRAKLTAALDAVIGSDDNGDGLPDTAPGASEFGQNDAEFRIFNTDRQLAALQTAVALLRGIRDRKTLIFFAGRLRLNGIDNAAQLRATTSAAVAANVTLNPVDTRGLIATAPLGDATQRPDASSLFTGEMAQSRISAHQRSLDVLFALADDTGGKASIESNDLVRGIGAAASAAGSHYLVGYYSRNIQQDGRFRRVHVTVPSHASAVVSTRAGYFGERTFGKTSAADRERQLEDAMRLELPLTDLPLSLEVNYFQVSQAEYFVPVTVKIPGREIDLGTKGRATQAMLDVIGEVRDAHGITVQNVRDLIKVPLDEQTAQRLASRSVDYQTGFTLLPGSYVLKLLARDARSGRIGTFETKFVVPNLERETTRTPMSSVVLSGQRVPLQNAAFRTNRNAATDAADPLILDNQKLVPSVTRVFSRARDLHVLFQAYRRSGPPRSLAVVVAFYRDGNLVSTVPLVVGDTNAAPRSTIPVHLAVPLAALTPGAYEVQVSLLDPGANTAAFWRAPILVVP